MDQVVRVVSRLPLPFHRCSPHTGLADPRFIEMRVRQHYKYVYAKLMEKGELQLPDLQEAADFFADKGMDVSKWKRWESYCKRPSANTQWSRLVDPYGPPESWDEATTAPAVEAYLTEKTQSVKAARAMLGKVRLSNWGTGRKWVAVERNRLTFEIAHRFGREAQAKAYANANNNWATGRQFDYVRHFDPNAGRKKARAAVANNWATGMQCASVAATHRQRSCTVCKAQGHQSNGCLQKKAVVNNWAAPAAFSLVVTWGPKLQWGTTD